jgi:molybdate transport system substrate-binding protein
VRRLAALALLLGAAVRRLAALALLLAAGCGGEAAGDGTPRLVVSAAASLTGPLTECSRGFAGADVRLSFAGSDELAAQIRRGVKPDVYAAADTALPEALAREGLLSEPVVFATNALVIAVPAEGGRVAGLDDLAEDVAIAMGAQSVPVGAYAREVLARLPAGQERAILANVRSEEPDVNGVVGKIAQGAADAGFVYRTDVTGGGLKAIELPAELRPEVAYGAGVVEGAAQPEPARRYLDGLRAGACADALRAAGFGAP